MPTHRKFKLQRAFTLVFSLLLTSCTVVQNTADLPGRTVSAVTGGQKKSAVDPVETQQTVLRLADEFARRAAVGIDNLRRETDALDPGRILQWKIALVSETCSIGSGPNPTANLVDMTVFVTVARSAMEEYWMPKVFGESAIPLLESWRNSETNIWRFTEKVLTPEQRTELRAAIETWRRQNPLPAGVLAARAVGFTSQGKAPGTAGPSKPGSVFNLLMIDPLAGMDPAVREIAQSRMFAERALYVSQKMPLLLRWQTELLTLNTTRLPAIQQLITNSTQVTSSMESFARVADQLPEIANVQREAAIQQIFAGLAAERTNWITSLATEEMKLRGTLHELRQTLNAGTDLVTSSDKTIKTLDAFLDRFKADTNVPAVTTTNTRPFDILDYAATAKEVTVAIRELNTTINSLDTALPRMEKTSETFERAGYRLINRLLSVGVILIVLFFVGAFITGRTRRNGTCQRVGTPLNPHSF